MKRRLLYSCLLLILSLVSWTGHAVENIPFIYVHGVGAPYQLFTVASSLPKTFSKLGRQLHVAKTPATATIEASAQVLEREVERLVPNGRYILLGHSMGGLVARAYLAKSKRAGDCLALVTVSTPHAGSPVADWAMRLINKKEGMDAQESDLFNLLLQWVDGQVEVLNQLTTRYMQDVFPRLYPRRPGVRYFSIGHYIPAPQVFYSQIPYLLAAHRINAMAGYPVSDGPVPVESSNFGTHLGNFPGDHYATQGPVPFGANLIYRQSFERLLKLLDPHLKGSIGQVK